MLKLEDFKKIKVSSKTLLKVVGGRKPKSNEAEEADLTYTLDDTSGGTSAGSSGGGISWD